MAGGQPARPTLPWCTYPKNKSLVVQQVWASGVRQPIAINTPPIYETNLLDIPINVLCNHALYA